MSETVERVRAARPLKEALDLLEELTSEEPCRFSRNGMCQEHAVLGDHTCPHGDAKRVLPLARAALDAPRESRAKMRAEVLEEAAKAAEEHYSESVYRYAENQPYTIGREIAEAIRALSEESP